MGNITNLHVPGVGTPPRPWSRVMAPDRYTYGLVDVALRLGVAGRHVAWVRRYVALLIASQGFPEPFPVPTRNGLTTDPTARSRWSIDAVDGWLAGRVPPGAAGQVDAIARRAAAVDMDRAARALVGSRR